MKSDRYHPVRMAPIYLSFWFLWVISSLAQMQTFTPPGQYEITYSVNIPQTTVSSGSGPIYFQLKSTRQVQWFAWGQGSQMRGANIFVVYTSGDNVTVSPRLGKGHFEPLYNPAAQISALNGSGVSDGIITANVRCDSCISWPGGSEDITSSSSTWIWAVKYGPSLNSDDLSATITEHDDFGVASLNLMRATGGSLENPFGTSTASSSAQAISTPTGGSTYIQTYTHATLMIVAFAILFPFSALGLHIFPSTRTVKVHASLQLVTLALAIAGMGLGIIMVKNLNLTWSYHPIIGIIVVSYLVLFQPFIGLLQHRRFRKTGDKSSLAYIHRWSGRIIIVLGIINGGLGFHLAGVGSESAPYGAVIAYSVAAAIIGLGYVSVIGLIGHRKRRVGTQ